MNRAYGAAFAVGVVLSATGVAWAGPARDEARIAAILAKTPLIDGHNDLPWEIRTRFQSRFDRLDLSKDTSKLASPKGAGTASLPPLMTDIPRLRAGRVGGQFWSVWIPAEETGPRAVEMTLEQIDLVKAMAAAYPTDFEMAYTAADIERIHAAGRIACLIGVEGGHQIDASLSVLRQVYAAGARYMTLAHFKNTPWSDSATDAPAHGGLTRFGKDVVLEMNRIGMLVDLSHVSAKTMADALDVTRAPVIFSHSGAYALDPTPRNVPDDILQRLKTNGGVVMANFYPGYVSNAVRQWGAALAGETSRLGALHPGDPKAVTSALEAWRAAHPAPRASLKDVADHIEYIAKTAGIDHVGLGSDFDGVEETPDGLDGVDKFPALLLELARRGWSDADLVKLAGGNLLRVMAQAESVAKGLRGVEPVRPTTIRDADGPA